MFGSARAILRALRKIRFAYEPLIEVRIRRDAIMHNLRAFQNLDKRAAVAPVLKSNSYGHGLVEVAKILDRENVPFLCVDSYFEALILRNEGIRSPILIIGYTPIKNILGSKLENVAFGIIGLEELRRFSENLRAPRTIHLKIDTGMHRHGILPSEFDCAIEIVRENDRIVLEGIYSHFADADTPDSPHTAAQIKTWNEVVERSKKELPNIRYFHIAATAGSFYSKKIDANTMRLGIGLYGINPVRNSPPISPTGAQSADEISNGVNASLAPFSLRPALEMVTRITFVRTVLAGEPIGYNATFTAPKDIRIATIPVGYNEGVDRRLSNKGIVLIRDIECPIVGRVSMNITSIDVSHIPDIGLDEHVVVISAEKHAPNSVENIARVCGTIPYEILVHIPAHLRRVVVSSRESGG